VRASVETERLILRRATGADLDSYCKRIYCDPTVMQMLPGRQTLPLSQARDRASTNLIEHWEKCGFGPWLVVEKGNGRVLGHCGLRRWSGSNDVEVLYALEHRAWGKGYATESAREALHAGFQELSLKRIIAGVVEENSQSIAVLSKLGMKPWEKREFQGLRVVMYELSRAEWNAA